MQLLKPYFPFSFLPLFFFSDVTTVSLFLGKMVINSFLVLQCLHCLHLVDAFLVYSLFKDL